MTLEEITLGFDTLTAWDFDWDNGESNGFEMLHQLCDAVKALPNPQQAIEVMFRVMERLSDADLGSPGPLVHILETFPDYHESLIASVQRKPTALTTWMVNRILNATQDAPERNIYLHLLQQAATHPLADASAKENAQDFLEYQHTQET